MYHACVGVALNIWVVISNCACVALESYINIVKNYLFH